MIVLTKIQQTCFACPSQWDAWTADGDYVYMRFRYGQGSVSTGDRSVADFRHGDSLDGFITLDEFMSHVSGKVRLAEDFEDIPMDDPNVNGWEMTWDSDK